MKTQLCWICYCVSLLFFLFWNFQMNNKKIWRNKLENIWDNGKEKKKKKKVLIESKPMSVDWSTYAVVNFKLLMIVFKASTWSAGSSWMMLHMTIYESGMKFHLPLSLPFSPHHHLSLSLPTPPIPFNRPNKQQACHLPLDFIFNLFQPFLDQSSCIHTKKSQLRHLHQHRLLSGDDWADYTIKCLLHCTTYIDPNDL